MRRLPSLSALLAFEAAARLGSFKRAAEELSVTPTAVSHQIKALETQLGLRLFRRETRRVVLTEDGACLYPGVADGFDALARAVSQTRKVPRRHGLTITATSAFAARWLVPRLSRMHTDLPGIDLRLLASDDVIDLHRAGVDLAIRYGSGVYPSLDSTLLLVDRFVPVAHPRLGLAQACDLAAAPIIRFDWRNPHPAHPTWESWFDRAGLRRSAGAPEHSFSDESHAIQAAIGGQGAALVSQVLVQEEISAGLLRPIEGPVLDGLAYYLVHRTMGRGTPGQATLQALKSWLRSEAGDGEMPTGVVTSPPVA